MNIDYGTILKIQTVNNDLSTVLLVNNSTSGTGFNCLVLDLDTKEIILDFEDLTDFKDNIRIIEKVGDLDELLPI